jgi:hypothetical protein
MILFLKTNKEDKSIVESLIFLTKSKFILMRIFYLFFFMTCILTVAISQNVAVQTLTYDSETRDTVIDFPEGDHNRFEKIIMHYSMRCKDALVSTTSERNKGCGEWDYSCNTYIVDSTRVDSVKALSPEFDMPGYAEDVFSYASGETYSFTQSIQKKITYDDVFSEQDYVLSMGDDKLDAQDWQMGESSNIYYIIDAEWFETNEVDRINGIRMDIEEEHQFKNLIVQLAKTEASTVQEALSEEPSWQKQHHYDTRLDGNDNLIGFIEDYRWDGTSSLLVSLSFDALETNSSGFSAEAIDPDKLLVCNSGQAHYMRFNGSGNLLLDETITDIKEQVTISFWHRGAENLPQNSTLIEAVDAAGRRQMNIHLPWSNGQVYWDCGNDGSGYDRINIPVDPTIFKGSWHHWAFVKNVEMGRMEIYVDGELLHSGMNLNREIDVQSMRIGANHSQSLSHFGDIDELRIWSRALDADAIKQYMHHSIPADHPDLENLEIYLDFNFETVNSSMLDQSSNSYELQTEGLLSPAPWPARNLFLDGIQIDKLINHNLVEGLYLSTVTDSIIMDSLISLPQRIDHYGLEGTDLVLLWSDYYYESGEYPVLDEQGNTVSTVNYPAAGEFERGELTYYQKSPMAFEIMSFVTPYGIGIDFGENGETWTFDVTDFAPVLKGKKRLYMSRGGQWQEEMDIRFEFIEGIPDRDIIDIQQIWRVDAVPYARILDDWRFEPRQFQYDPSVASYVIKTAITGHGQQGEFIPRNHLIDVDGFVDTWSVWKECAENPVYPQGGTWVYDRAGWCPGMATDVREYDVTPYFQFAQNPTVDYSVQTASGDSRYIVSSQLLQYGPANKNYDVSILDVIHPNNKIEHGRFNPSCHAPELIIKNHGGQTINNATIYYGIEGKTESVFQWQGTLPFLIEQNIILPYSPELALAEPGDQFFARIELPGFIDESPANNLYLTDISLTDEYTQPLVIEWRTNLTPNETSYRLEDENGELILFKSGTTLSNNTVYRDTLFELNGCYRLLISDNDQDGISWWANNDGNGYIRVKEVGGAWRTIATDFGAFVEYNFTAGMISSVQDFETVDDVFIYPNPGNGEAFISELLGWDEELNMRITDRLGRQVASQKLSSYTLSHKPVDALFDLTPGMYFVTLHDSKRRTTIRYTKI